MKRWWVGVLLIGLLVGCTAARPTPAPRRDRPVQVVASIGPLGYFARQVGGERVQVTVLLPPGRSPHDFEPTPAQMRRLSEADLVVLNGVGLEFWADRVLTSLGLPPERVVVTSEGLDILQETDHGGGNPHVWLDPINAAFQAARIRDALIAVDPDGKDVYLANGARLIEDLKALDREILLTVARWPRRRFIAFHAAWAYFARRYGLEQAAVIEETPGQEPSPGQLARIVAVARAIDARAIFAEPQLSPKAAEVIAQEAGLRVLVLDPLGTPPEYDYFQTMRWNVQTFAEALGAAP